MIKVIQKIPEGWNETKFEDLGEFFKGSGITKNDLVQEGVPCIRYAELYTKFNFTIPDCVSFVSEKTAKAAKKIQKGDLLLAGSGETKEEIGKCAVYMGNVPAYAGGDNIIFRANKSIPLYLSFFLNTLGRKQLNKLGQGDSIVHIHSSDLKNVVIPLPPLAEQEKIAEILGAWDSAIEKLTALIAAKRLQKKGLMQKLLTAQIRLPGFTGEWKKQTLGCLFSFHRSLSASRAHLGEIGIPYLHYGDIHKTGKTSFNPETDELPKLDYRENAEKYLLKNGDVVFVDASEDRKDASRFCVIKNKNNVPFLAGLHTVVARPKSDELNVDFSEFLFQSNDFRKQVSILANGMKIFGVSKDILSNIVIQYPQNIVEQKAIADILSKADEEIDLLTRKLDLIQSQKKGLMQQLLTGKIRVKVA